ncbi:MAG: AI-2E family transporter [Planctomycetota bacterium]|jgi:predicted PurR-regulated permease PerM
MAEVVDARKRRRRVVFLLVFLTLIFLVIFAFRAVLGPFLIAIFFAYLIDPVIERAAVKVTRGGAIVILYLVLLGLLYLGAIFAVPALGRQLHQAREDLPKAQATLEKAGQYLEEKYHEFVGTPLVEEPETEGDADEPTHSRIHLKPEGQIVGRVVGRTKTKVSVQAGDEFYVLDRKQILREEAPETPKESRLISRLGADEVLANLKSFLGFALKVGSALIETVMKLVLILMITAFLVIDRPRIVRFIKSLAPEQYRATYETLTQYIDRGLAGVIRGQLGICAVNAILTTIGLEFLGVSYSLLLGMVAGVFSLIPIFGTIISTIPIVLIAWGAGTFQKGMLALGWILLIHFLEANYLNPRIMGTASKIHPVVIIFALVAGEHAYGIPGALLAVPAASILQSAFVFYVVDRAHEKTAAPEGT